MDADPPRIAEERHDEEPEQREQQRTEPQHAHVGVQGEQVVDGAPAYKTEHTRETDDSVTFLIDFHNRVSFLHSENLQRREARERKGSREQQRIEPVEPAAVAGQHAVPDTHLRAHESVLDLVCRLLLEKKKKYILVTLVYSSTVGCTSGVYLRFIVGGYQLVLFDTICGVKIL